MFPMQRYRRPIALFELMTQLRTSQRVAVPGSPGRASTLSPKTGAAGYLFECLGDLAFVLGLQCDVGHCNDAREAAVRIYDGETTDLLVAHQADRFKHERVRLDGKELSRHNVANW